MSVARKLSVRRCLLLRRNFVFFATKSALLVLVVAAMDLAKAQTVTNSVLYQLNTDSSFMQGCFPPCLCPVMIGASVKGTFELSPAGFDGLFNTYAVTNVNWLVAMNDTNVLVTGSGTYKVGGEVALQQELSLDLQLGASKVAHFDSGLVAESAPFPEIKVAISTNHQFCFDTLFNVSASPTPTPQAHLAFASNNTIMLSWPVSAGPALLQESSDLTMTNWTILTNALTVVGQQNQIVLPRSPENRFYRLQPGGN